MPEYRRRKVREATSVRVDVNGVMAETLGQSGLSREDLAGAASRINGIARQLRGRRERGELPFLDLPYASDAVRRVKAMAQELRAEAETLVVLGVGGSARGAQAILEAVPGDRQVLFVDNIDPWSFGEVVDNLDLEHTVFNVISKSGETAETVGQFLVIRDRLLKTFGAVDYKHHLVVTTDPEQGYLRQIVSDEGFRDLPLPSALAGRFSVLSAVGLLPAAFAGLEIDDLLAGGARMDERTAVTELWKNPAYLLATVLWDAWTRRGKSMVVFMPYSDRLVRLGAWFVQLWAESLGKAEGLGGRVSRAGQTPVLAVGAADQHSQLQLFFEGPDDKIYVLLRVEDHGREFSVPPSYEDLEGVRYLGGKRLGELLNMEEEVTELGLAQKGRPVIRVAVPRVDLFALGQLFYLFEVTVAVAGALADLNPFDQPGVEGGKRLAYALAGRQGFAAEKERVQEWRARRRPEYVL